MSTMALVGVQEPRICSVPEEADYEVADRALEWLDEIVGFELDEWQRMVLRESLAESEPGRWAATEVGLVVPRQNGKGAILEARELVGLFLLDEPLLIHSAHQFKTSKEHFLRITARIEAVPELKTRVRAIATGAGSEGVFLRSGARLRFLARKGGSGRGFSAPFIALDEAMDLPEGAMADMIPTQSAMPRRQRWYAGSAVDQMEEENGVVLARVRERGIRGDTKRLAYFEWSLDYDNPDQVPPEVLADDDAIAVTNPGYGIRVEREAVEDELAALSARTVAVERFNVGDWPQTGPLSDHVIDPALWDSLAQPTFRSDGLTPALAYDVAPDQSWASIAAGFACDDGVPLLEIVEHRRGVRWLVDRLTELVEAHNPLGVLCGASSPAEAFVHQLEAAGVDVEVIDTSDHAQACNLLVSLAENERLRHLGTAELKSALRGAARRPLGDSWLWSRKNSTVDISPLVASTLSLWGWSRWYDGDRDWTIY